MALRLLLAGLHLLALGIGLGAVVVRGRALQSELDVPRLRRVFAADNLWGLAALLWISTGVWRFLGGVEKGTAYYLANHVFLTKMGLLALILVLELRPMITLIRWRRDVAASRSPDTALAPRLALVSFWQAGLVIVMVFLAAAMARGMGA
jgi:putative membrane protein